MKNFKMLLCAMILSICSIGSIIGMEYQPKVYIKNHNIYSRLRSGGILCKINGDEQLIFVPMKSPETFLGHARTIRQLVLQPSTSGTGISGWVFKPETFSVTEQLQTLLKDQQNHPNEDILIFVENKASPTGYWDIKMRWVDKQVEAMPIAPVKINQALKEAYAEWKRTRGDDDTSSGEDWSSSGEG